VSSALVHIGVISDTHGLVREAALVALEGSELILHAGDIGSPGVLETLRRIAPTRAVRGNNDTAAWARDIPARDMVTVHDHHLYLLHDLGELDIDPAASGFAAVVCGHTHKPLAEWREGVLYLNPGSAGPRRFRLPIAVARLRVTPAAIEHEIVELAV
jgi:uncharacterized protein